MESPGFFSRLREKFFTFHGRLNRKPYILRSLVVMVVPVTLAIALFVVFAGGLRPQQEYLHKDLFWLHAVLHSLLIFLAIFAGLSLGVRRCHDLDKSGWMLLLGAVPYINVFWGLYLIFKRGTVGSNRYGDDPIRNDYDRIEDIAEELQRQRDRNFDRKE